MRCVRSVKSALCISSAAAVLSLGSPVLAGGFEIREQSAYFQGTSFAGAAAGGQSLSSVFWNPAASAYVGYGLTTDSNLSVIFARSEIDVTGIGAKGANLGGCAVFACSVDIGGEALVPASYLAWRYDGRTVFALALNSQFGSTTKPDDPHWLGAPYTRTSKLFSINANPSVSYEVVPGISVGAGLQVQFLDLVHLRSAAGPPLAPSATLEGDGTGIGLTAGINFRPNPGTSIGLGYRSSVRHNIEGSFSVPGAPTTAVEANVDTPDKVTLSFTQALAPNVRLLGTVDWDNWSKLGVVRVTPTTPAGNVKLDFQWHDGWLFALGGEWDINPQLTLRAGAAYEISPIQNPSERLVQLPDADRVWLSVGGSYKLSEATSLNVGYSHIFVDDATLQRSNATGTAPTLFADTSASGDIVSVGLTMKWGAPPSPAPLK